MKEGRTGLEDKKTERVRKPQFYTATVTSNIITNRIMEHCSAEKGVILWIVPRG
jgi:hypothetical protein